MATNILSIGQSALAAAQVGISVTGHNIANAATPGYNRQVVIQGTAGAQNFGYGYVGQGTQISSVERIYNEILARQVVGIQSSSSALEVYESQMSRIDSLLSDANAGVSPALQDFFNSLHSLSANPGDAATRQAALSTAQSLADRFQSFNDRFSELSDNVNTQLGAGVSEVNTYAQAIAKLNDVIEKSYGTDKSPPNDLLDQRDQLVSDLSKRIKTTVVNQEGGKYNLFIGSGMPLVVGTQSFTLTTVNSDRDTGRLDVAYVGKDKNTVLGAEVLQGGTIGGLLEFREKSLVPIRNQLGLIAVTVAQTFNAQHAQGLDIQGKPGGNFFSTPVPAVSKGNGNTGDAIVSSEISDIGAMTSSDYQVKFDGSNYLVTRLSDNTLEEYASLPQTFDGITIKIDSGSMKSGDTFLIQPSANGMANFKLAIDNIAKIAAGAPVVTGSSAKANSGNASISDIEVSSSYASSPLSTAFSLSYDANAKTLSGFPAGEDVTVTAGSTSKTYAAGTPVPYTSGASISVAGLAFTVSGSPADGDQFTISPGIGNASGDNRNALKLAGLQTAELMSGNTSTYENAFNQLVSLVGNKTRELQVTHRSESQMLMQAVAAVQSESGVNLDEEATNLLRYQQAYQAAGKMMQIASQMFEVLLSLGQ